ncbi:MAG: hypothetical protein P4M11_13455 [Candidatus Pacebacteria bacterium]|nr:hypothetical protein [Candidatus Paceibacterota bacterium]
MKALADGTTIGEGKGLPVDESGDEGQPERVDICLCRKGEQRLSRDGDGDKYDEAQPKDVEKSRRYGRPILSTR